MPKKRPFIKQMTQNDRYVEVASIAPWATLHVLTLKERVERLRRLTAKFAERWDLVSTLVALGSLSARDLLSLQVSLRHYATASLGDSGHRSLAEINAAMSSRPPRCLTHNGILAPKRETTQPYSEIVRRTLQTLTHLGIADSIRSISKINVRVRAGTSHLTALSDNTCAPHTDIWADEYPNSIHVVLILWRDRHGTSIDYFPVYDFDAHDRYFERKPVLEWATALPGLQVPLTMRQKAGTAIVSDIAVPHATSGTALSGFRWSLDFRACIDDPSTPDEPSCVSSESRRSWKAQHPFIWLSKSLEKNDFRIDESLSGPTPSTSSELYRFHTQNAPDGI